MITTPHHRNSNGRTVVISRYTDGQSVGINFYRQTTPVGASPLKERDFDTIRTKENSSTAY